MKSLKKPPFGVTLLGFMALTLVVLNVIRLSVALSQWHVILDFMPHPGPLYIAISGLVWSVGWLAVYISCLRSDWHQRHLVALIVSAGYVVYYWLDRFFLQNVLKRTNTKFALLMTFIFMVIVMLACIFSRDENQMNGEIDESRKTP